MRNKFSITHMLFGITLLLVCHPSQSFSHAGSTQSRQIQSVGSGSYSWQRIHPVGESLQESEFPTAERWIRLPWGQKGEVSITDFEGRIVYSGISEEMDSENAAETVSLHNLTSAQKQQLVHLGKAGILRDVTIAPLQFTTSLELETGVILAVDHIEVQLLPGEWIASAGEEPLDRPVPDSFYQLYRSLCLDELDELGVRRSDCPGSILMIAHASYVPRLNNYITWKEELGFTILLPEVHSELEASEVQDTIRFYYETADPPLEHVLLVGDVVRGGNTRIPPSARVQNPNAPLELDVTDWRYTWLEGDDALPEVWIGRMPVGTASEAMNASSRVPLYENPSDQENPSPAWDRAVLIAGNYSDGHPPYTVMSSSRQLGEWMQNDWGIEIDSAFWDVQNPNPPFPGDLIDEGAMWVAFRGWGNATGWVRPEFYSSEIGMLENPLPLPIVTSYTCNTGDFGNENHNKSFGEYWITAGTYNTPRGATAFIGSTDLHTNSKYNNPLLIGFYRGIYDEGITNISAALQRAKLELMAGFPLENQQEMNEFYSQVYHVLGDPALQMWKHRPLNLEVTAADVIQSDANSFSVLVSNEQNQNPLQNAQVSLNGQFLNLSGYTNDAGQYTFTLPNELPNELTLTVFKPDFYPQQRMIRVEEPEFLVTFQGFQLANGMEEYILPGEEVTLSVRVLNKNEIDLTNVMFTLSHPSEELVSIVSPTAIIGDLPPDGEGINRDEPFLVELVEYLPDGVELEFDLLVSCDQFVEKLFKVWIPTKALDLKYHSHETIFGTFEVGETVEYLFTFENRGSGLRENVNAFMYSWDEAVEIRENQTMLIVHEDDQFITAENSFLLQVAGDTYAGRQVRLEVQFFDEDENSLGVTGLVMEIEGAEAGDPTGPDQYGYFIYDDTDTQWDQAPEYEWYDLENLPDATLYELSEDENIVMEMPFEFPFYGYSTDSLTISSNGWIAFYPEHPYTRHMFRNWSMGAGIGPHYMLAAFWDDLKSPQGERMEVYTWQGEDRFVIEYSNTVTSWSYQNQDYQAAEFTIVLLDPAFYPTPTGDGIIEIHYREADNEDQDNNFCTVGIQDYHHRRGLQYTYANEYPATAAVLQAERAICFTTIAPDNYNPSEEGKEALPREFALQPVYPNPFNSEVMLRLELPLEDQVRLSVHNILGQEIAILRDGVLHAGQHTTHWDASTAGLSTGLLIFRMEVAEKVYLQKGLYVK
ncbi:hypothetical protein K8I28_04590 [bacterium]|nr:hypothetical protein [bacterium]